MRNLLRQQKTSFQVVIVPVFPDKEMRYSRFLNYPLSDMHREIVHFLVQNEIKVFDLLDSFKDQNKKANHYAFDVWHPNAEGHRVMAHALLQPVLSEVL